MALNNSQEQPLIREEPRNIHVSHKKNQKRRIFSSAGGRKNRLLKNKNRVQTAKHLNNRPYPNNKWRGGSQLYGYKPKGRGFTSGDRSSTKKKKKIPLGEYNWPEDKNPHEGNGRPITASHGNYVGPHKHPTDYDKMRQEVQSRGKAIPTGLSGTSQSSHMKDGTNEEENNDYYHNEFSKTQGNNMNNMKDLILAESEDPHANSISKDVEKSKESINKQPTPEIKKDTKADDKNTKLEGEINEVESKAKKGKEENKPFSFPKDNE